MKYATLYFAIASILFCSCGDAPADHGNNYTETDTTEVTAEVTADDSTIDAGQTDPDYIEIEGLTANRKGGAVVVTDSIHYWIDGQHSWDDVNDKMVSVTGWLEIRDDNPVVLDTGDVVSQGIPVNTSDELEANKWRHWIIDATITVKE